MKISTEAEFVGVDDASSLILWTKLILEAQEYKVEEILNIRITKVPSYYRKTVTTVRVKGQDI